MRKKSTLIVKKNATSTENAEKEHDEVQKDEIKVNENKQDPKVKMQVVDYKKEVV